jgi:hypothetical protein
VLSAGTTDDQISYLFGAITVTSLKPTETDRNAQSMSDRTADQLAFGRKLFEVYPEFLPTRSLYVDLEGSGSGNEQVVSIFWPQNPSRTRFEWAVARPSEVIDRKVVNSLIDNLGADIENINSVVVYSAGREDPDERTRLIDLLDYDPWPNATWVNLLYVTQLCTEMRRAIRAHRNVVFHSDRTQVRRSLEALEWEFGIFRTPEIRGHNNIYSDGISGDMHPLQSASDYAAGLLGEEEMEWFEAYCRQDVESMFKISRKCDRALHTSTQSRLRRQQYS